MILNATILNSAAPTPGELPMSNTWHDIHKNSDMETLQDEEGNWPLG